MAARHACTININITPLIFLLVLMLILAAGISESKKQFPNSKFAGLLNQAQLRISNWDLQALKRCLLKERRSLVRRSPLSKAPSPATADWKLSSFLLKAARRGTQHSSQSRSYNC
jgi:hypothetical protein